MFVVAAGVGYEFKSTPPTYLDSAAVIFNLPQSQTAPNAYFSHAASLITSGNAMTKILASPQTQRAIREAGGTADVSLALNNLYNQQYPDYGEPLATLTAAAPSAAGAHRAFVVSARLIGHLLAARQAQAGVPGRDRIFAQIVGDTGPIAQAGSPRRAFAGLALLAVIAAAVARGLIDRVSTWHSPPLSAFRGVPPPQSGRGHASWAALRRRS